MNNVQNVIANAKNRVLIIENRNSKHQHHRSIDKTKETPDGFLREPCLQGLALAYSSQYLKVLDLWGLLESSPLHFLCTFEHTFSSFTLFIVLILYNQILSNLIRSCSNMSNLVQKCSILFKHV